MNGYIEALEITNKRIDELKKLTVEGDQRLSKAVLDLIDQVEVQAKIIEILANKLDAWEEISTVVVTHNN